MMWKTKWGKCIYTSISGYKVHQNLFYRWLTLGSNALQTVINRSNPQKPILYYLPALTLMARTNPGNTCLLGLGGAGVAQILNSNGSSLIAVDNSAEVIHIAKQFFLADQINYLSIVHQNAADYVAISNEQYSHLIIDLYGAHHFPEECNNEAFFINCKKRLKKEGYLAINIANYKEQLNLYQFVRKQFNATLVIPVKKSANMVVLASQEEKQEDFINKINQTGEIKKIVWMDVWGYVGWLK